MTREEQINQALESYPNKYDNGAPESVTAYNEGYDDGFETGFVEGIAWADANPQWHKYPDEKPPKNTDEVSKVVFVQTKKGLCPIKAHMFYEQRKNEYEIICVEHWYSPELKYNLLNDEIIAWMELPQPPKFD